MRESKLLLFSQRLEQRYIYVNSTASPASTERASVCHLLDEYFLYLC